MAQQVAAADSSLKQYPFIKIDSNFIGNDSVSLYPFFEKLKTLKDRKCERVNIVHIGDSHIQADFFSGKMRENFHRDFGNAGIGFVFPYRVAKTNEPYNYKTSTNVLWDSKRNVFPDKPLPIGLGGITIESSDSLAEINFMINEKNLIDYSFKKLTLFHEKGKGSYDYKICDEFNCSIGKIKSDSITENSFISVLKLDKPVKQFTLRCSKSDSFFNQCSRIYGMLLENEQPGVLYNAIGVNGGEYRYYNASCYFVEQMSYLRPDLIIISMGTNEGFYKGFDSTVFYSHIDSFVVSIKNKNPGAAFLLTTPGDSYRKARKGKVPNPDMKSARNTIIEYCKRNNLAYWDLYEIMGGYRSMGKWYASKLTSKDKLHFSRKGYEIQGELFYSALMNAYKEYLKK